MDTSSLSLDELHKKGAENYGHEWLTMNEWVENFFKNRDPDWDTTTEENRHFLASMAYKILEHRDDAFQKGKEEGKQELANEFAHNLHLYEAHFEPKHPVGGGLIIMAESVEDAWAIAVDTVRHTHVTGITKIPMNESGVVFYDSGEY